MNNKIILSLFLFIAFCGLVINAQKSSACDFMEGIAKDLKVSDDLRNFLKTDPHPNKGKAWLVLKDQPLYIRTDDDYLNVIKKYLDDHNPDPASLDLPFHEGFIDDWIQSLSSMTTPYPNLGQYPIPYLSSYINSDITLLSSDGAFKLVYDITGEPDKVLKRLRHEEDYVNPTDFKVLDDEINDLRNIEAVGFPIGEIYGMTNHRGIASMVMKKYPVAGVRTIQKVLDVDPTLVVTTGIADLFSMRNLAENLQMYIQDLQFIVTSQGRFLIDDIQDAVPSSSSYLDTVEEFDDLLDSFVERFLNGEMMVNQELPVSSVLNDILDNSISADYLENVLLATPNYLDSYSLSNGIVKRIQ